MNHLLRELALVPSSGWEVIESEARARLQTALGARRLVDFSGPHGWSRSVADLGRVEPLEGPGERVGASRRRVLPYVELRTGFELSRRELDATERGARDVDLSGLEEAALRIAVAENSLVFQGYQAAGVTGVVEATAHAALELGGVEHYPRSVARAVEALRREGIGAPYGLAAGPDSYTAIIETAEHGGHLLLDHLRTILGGPVVWCPGLQGAVVVSMRGGDFVLEVGQDLSIGYQDHDTGTVRLYLEESLAFLVLEPAAAVALR
ncbi:MAG: family 1 encapsulin nanocompartment shell protein [Acidimicrobiales bacterium]